MTADEVKALPRAELVKTALWMSDMQEVLSVMEHLNKMTKSVDGALTVVRDDGEDIAMVWWDNESETWLCNWMRGSGA